MGNNARAEANDIFAILIRADLCETFFFGTAMFLIPSAYLSQRTGVYTIVFLFTTVFMLYVCASISIPDSYPDCKVQTPIHPS